MEGYPAMVLSHHGIFPLNILTGCSSDWGLIHKSDPQETIGGGPYSSMNSHTMYNSDVEPCICKAKQIGATGFNYNVGSKNCRFKLCSNGQLNIVTIGSGQDFEMYSLP